VRLQWKKEGRSQRTNKKRKFAHDVNLVIRQTGAFHGDTKYNYKIIHSSLLLVNLFLQWELWFSNYFLGSLNFFLYCSLAKALFDLKSLAHLLAQARMINQYRLPLTPAPTNTADRPRLTG